MEIVEQKHRKGCGIACVAMIRGISYNQAKRLFPLPIQVALSQIGGTTISDVRKALRGYASVGACRPYFPAENRPYFPWNEDRLIALHILKKKQSYHWCLWDSEKRQFLDPKLHSHEEVVKELEIGDAQVYATSVIQYDHRS